MDLGLKGKRAIVTGGSRGIGKAIADTLAGEGVDIAICARGQEGVDAQVDALKGKGVNAYGEAVDVTSEAYEAFINNAANALGGLDIFVSNVSAMGGRQDVDGWRANFETDVLSTVRGAQTAIPHMEASGGGSIVIIATTAALETFGGPQAYNSMKAAIINYSSNLAQDLAPKKIRVNAVSPGAIYFKGGAWEFIENNMPDMYNGVLGQIPAGRFGDPQDIANAVTFLSSPAADYATATNLVVDGGLTKRVQY